MKGAQGTRIQVVLVCEKCGARNYKASRPRTIDGKPLEFRKYCPPCGVHTVHRESK